jgi:hypothetical protein
MLYGFLGGAISDIKFILFQPSEYLPEGFSRVPYNSHIMPFYVLIVITVVLLVLCITQRRKEQHVKHSVEELHKPPYRKVID